MGLGVTYSLGLNAVPVVDFSAVSDLYPISTSVAGGFPLAGTSLATSGGRIYCVGKPVGGPVTASGTITITYTGGSATVAVSLTAVNVGPALPPNITIVPLTIPSGVSGSVEIMDLNYAVRHGPRLQRWRRYPGSYS
jgi:hypothetical protein